MELSKEELAALLQQAFVAGFQYSEEGINGEVCSKRQREKMLAEATEYAAKGAAQAV